MKIGDKVTYVSFNKVEHGIVKSIIDENYVFVVYNCDNNWDRYFDYTAARTRIYDLEIGWKEIAPQMEFLLKDYLGDGAYGLFDGFAIWLHANDPDSPTDRICLEPGVLNALNRFAARCDNERKKTSEEKNNEKPI